MPQPVPFPGPLLPEEGPAEIDPVVGATRFIGDELPIDATYLALAAASATSRQLFAVPFSAVRVLQIDLDVERVSLAVLLRQLERLAFREGSRRAPALTVTIQGFFGGRPAPSSAEKKKLLFT